DFPSKPAWIERRKAETTDDQQTWYPCLPVEAPREFSGGLSEPNRRFGAFRRHLPADPLQSLGAVGGRFRGEVANQTLSDEPLRRWQGRPGACGAARPRRRRSVPAPRR